MENQETIQQTDRRDTGFGRGRLWANRQGRGTFWGLALLALGGFWLVSNLDLVPEPAKIVLPALVITWGIAVLFTRRATE
jgi:hypothetical protein